MERNGFAQREVAHLREASTEFQVLGQEALCRCLEGRVRRREQVGHRRAREVLHGYAKPLSLDLQLCGLRGGQLEGNFHVATLPRGKRSNKAR